jgi:hypothetical protein
MQYQHTKREPEMAELIEGSERDRRRLAELLDGISCIGNSCGPPPRTDMPLPGSTLCLSNQ